MKIDTVVFIDEEKNRRFTLDPDVFIMKRGNYKYVMSPKEDGMCPVCLKKTKNLTAHHLIPRRVVCSKSPIEWRHHPLKELRIRVCSQCHLEIDGINKYILACKKLSKLLHDATDGAIKYVKSYKDIQESLDCIDLNNWYGEESWNNRKLEPQGNSGDEKCMKLQEYLSGKL